MIKPELLAPAGDLERLKFAFLYGADAVYIGGPAFGLRANATNFSMDDIKEATTYAHKLNKKVYVTVNIVLHNSEINELDNYLNELENRKVDAIIVSDPTVIERALKITNLEVHLSTQQSTLNKEAAQYWKDLGVTRIVMAREASKEDLKDILDNVDIEIETFIHGAMCSGYSGRCVLSNYLTARDANRGGCSQICRWDFKLKDKNNQNIEADKDFTLCTKDLSMLKHIPEMIDMGITSFKIEGRMRSIYYIATIVDIYRKVIDEYCSDKQNYTYNKKYEMILNNCANRDSIPQFFKTKEDYTYQYYNGRVEISNQDFLGLILDYDEKSKMLTIEQRNYFKKGDLVEIFGPNMNTIELTIDNIYDENNNLIEIVRHPRQIVKIKFDKKIPKYALMRIKKNNIDNYTKV